MLTGPNLDFLLVNAQPLLPNNNSCLLSHPLPKAGSSGLSAFFKIKLSLLTGVKTINNTSAHVENSSEKA